MVPAEATSGVERPSFAVPRGLLESARLGRGCRTEPLEQSAIRIVGAEGAEGQFRNSDLRRVAVWRTSSDEEELEIESERGGSIVDGRFHTAAIGELDLDTAYIRGGDAVDPEVFVRSRLVRASGDEVVGTTRCARSADDRHPTARSDRAVVTRGEDWAFVAWRSTHGLCTSLVFPQKQGVDIRARYLEAPTVPWRNRRPPQGPSPSAASRHA